MPDGDRTDWGFERTFGGCHPHEAEEAKGVRADLKRLEKLNTQRREMLSLIPLLTSGWIKVIDDEIAKTIRITQESRICAHPWNSAAASRSRAVRLSWAPGWPGRY